MKNLKQHINERVKEEKLEERILSKRTKASPAARAKLLKPYDINGNGRVEKATRLKVKNAMTDLDHIAWQMENEFDVGTGTRARVVNEIDRTNKSLELIYDLL